jgi:sec-independent protein translocase protein TatC
MMPQRAPGNQERSSSDHLEELRATWGEHLEELRIRLFRIAALLAAGTLVGWFLFPYAYAYLTDMATSALPKGIKYEEAFRNITEPFFLQLKLAFYLGLIITLPLSVLQLWGFVSPGLRPHERRPFKIIVPLSLVLFVMGATICWFTLPAAIAWFADFATSFKNVKVIQEPGLLVFFIVKMLLAFGACFQMPLVVYFLVKIGILTTKGLLRYWRQAIFVIFLAAGIITPSGDPFTMIILALPMTGLFFGSVWAAQISQKKGGIDVLDDLD